MHKFTAMIAYKFQFRKKNKNKKKTTALGFADAAF